MKSEEEIRKEIENFTNQMKNSEFMYEQTTAESFRKMVYETGIFINALKFVLGEFKPIEETKIVDTKTLSVE